jgi:hypothetical protein
MNDARLSAGALEGMRRFGVAIGARSTKNENPWFHEVTN